MLGLLTRKTFVGVGTAGSLQYPGTRVEIDDRVFQAPDPKTVGKRPKNSNVLGFTDEDAARLDSGPTTQVTPIAPVTPHAPGATRPQGVGPGNVSVGDRFLGPATPESGHLAQEFVAGTPENDPNTLAAMRAQFEQAQARAQEDDLQRRAEAAVRKGEAEPDTLQAFQRPLVAGFEGTAPIDEHGKPITDPGNTDRGSADAQTMRQDPFDRDRSGDPGGSKPTTFASLTKSQLSELLESGKVEIPEDVTTKEQLRALAEEKLGGGGDPQTAAEGETVIPRKA